MNEPKTMKQLLLKLAQNLWWTWHPEIIEIWREIDPQLWRECRHSPILFINSLSDHQLQQLSKDASLKIKIHRAFSELTRYMESTSTWASNQAAPLKARPVVYLSAEIGIHESFPLYSGGLGVLAGDHLKSASDLGVPMVGVSLFYRDGYFRQKISETGDQTVDYENTNPENLPLQKVLDMEGNPLIIELPIQGGNVRFGAWKAQLGRIQLFFLDTEEAFRKIGLQDLGSRLYGGEKSVRLSQEMLLGIGGMRLVLSLGINPGVIHINEGHSAFAPLEYTRHLMRTHDISFEKAIKQAGSQSVFTTHTPVPAGHDSFPSDLMEKMAGKYRDSLGLSPNQFMDMGRVHPGDNGEPFNMTAFALRTASKSNAVSFKHGKLTRRMWNVLWPDYPHTHVPIGHITNGISVLGWLSPAMKNLFHRYCPAQWEKRIGEREIWDNISSIPDEELWDTILLLKNKLIRFLPRHPYRAHPREYNFDPQTLTLGFARRFTEYKRAALLMDDPERLLSLLNHPQHPLQMVFSGKAHPHDEVGKGLIKKVCQFAQDPRVQGRIVFIEDYDMNVARHMVEGVDLWLNNPREGLEACGTSGMKVALNGGLNLSILDGWWPEGYDGTNGFAVTGSMNENPDIQNKQDRESLFRVLEEEVIPLYYKRNAEDIPHQWLHRIKQAMSTLGWRFSADRMVMDYVRKAYLPAAGIITSHMDAPFV